MKKNQTQLPCDKKNKMNNLYNKANIVIHTKQIFLSTHSSHSQIHHDQGENYSYQSRQGGVKRLIQKPSSPFLILIFWG